MKIWHCKYFFHGEKILVLIFYELLARLNKKIERSRFSSRKCHVKTRSTGFFSFHNEVDRVYKAKKIVWQVFLSFDCQGRLVFSSLKLVLPVNMDILFSFDSSVWGRFGLK